MSCYRCGTRQVDPIRGSSPWQRGVRADRQVLICPGCQAAGDWMAELDRCPVCSSVHLVRRLGEVECRDCGAVGESAVPASVSASFGAADDLPSGLAEEVEQALARVLRRSPRPAGIS
jgi:hypothetical protein